MKIQRPVYKGFRLIASLIILVFMFVEELILAPLRKIKVVVLENTIKRMNGYWTIGVLVFLKTIEGLCKVALPFAPNATVVMIIIVIDGVLGFISMNIIIHGHDNLKDFTWYVKTVKWVWARKDEIKATNLYKNVHAKVVEVKAEVKAWWAELVFKIFGKRKPRGLYRYIKTAIYLRQRKTRD